MVSASAASKKLFSKTKFLSFDPFETCERLKLLLQEKQAGNYSVFISDETVAIADTLFEYNCVSTKQHENLLIKCLS